MEKDNEALVYEIPGYKEGESLVFNTEDTRLEIDSEHEEIIWKILSEANGLNSRQQIVEALSESDIDIDEASDVIDDLIALGIVGRATAQYVRFHPKTNNPNRSYPDLSSSEIMSITSRPYPEAPDGQQFSLAPGTGSIAELANERHSVRSFESKPLQIGEIGELLTNTFSTERTPIPSAGGLNALRVYGIIKPGHEVPAGVYYYDPTNHNIVCIDNQYDQDEVAFCLNQEDSLHDAPFVIVLAADLTRHNEKYGDRGYRYAILEAGHAAQNTHLTSTELGLGSLEYGGFSDAEIKKLLMLDEGVEPLITIAVGHPSEEVEKPIYKTLIDFQDAYLGEDKPLDHVGVNMFTTSNRHSRFYSASAHYRRPNEAYSEDKDERYAAGTALSMDLAQVKAMAEAYERYASGKITVDMEVSANAMKERWMKPQDIRPLTSKQINKNPHVAEFNPDQIIQWVRGQDSKGDIYVPVECVFYPLTNELLGRQLFSESDSSGVAAFTDEKTATERALFELIERDAIMRNWFNQKSPDRIKPELLPQALGKRVEYWQNNGFDIHFLDMSTDVPIIQTVIVNQEANYPYFSNGASAAYTHHEAAKKSLEEAELGLVHALDSDTHPGIDAQSVRTPVDHGAFYYQPENRHHIEWLWAGEFTDHLGSAGESLDIVAKYDPIVIRLNSGGEPLHVVRVIVQNLVPISFGTGNEYYTHPSSGVSRKPNHIGSAPHYFA